MKINVLQKNHRNFLNFDLGAEYVGGNDVHCFYNERSLVTDLQTWVQSLYRVQIDGKIVDAIISTQLMLKIEHDLKTNKVIVRNIKKTGNINATCSSKDDGFDFRVDSVYIVSDVKKLPPSLAKIAEQFEEEVKQAIEIAFKYHLVETENFQNFQKCQNQIIEKIEEYSADIGWDNYLENLVDPTAMHYQVSCLYPQI